VAHLYLNPLYSQRKTPTAVDTAVDVALARMGIAENLARKIIMLDREVNLSDSWRVLTNGRRVLKKKNQEEGNQSPHSTGTPRKMVYPCSYSRSGRHNQADGQKHHWR